MKTILCTLTASILLATGLSAADAAAGKAAYDKSCKSCHGATGAPNPGVAKMTKVEMKDLGSADAQGKSDAELKAIITNGVGKMKPSTTVTGAAVDDVVAFVRTLKK
jgi:mono/diheme cytochrome c family protein